MLMKSLEDQLLELKRKKLINEMKLKKMQGQNFNDGIDIGEDEHFYFNEDSSQTNSHNDTLTETYLRPWMLKDLICRD